MNKFRFTLNLLVCLVLTLTFASLAQAQATRTWVSGVGDDVNPCSRTAPCKTFAGAISKTATNGEINALDPGGFGTLTITKSITVDGEGTNASVLSALAPQGFIVNDSASATPGTAIVRIRNVTINGVTTGTRGIRFFSGKILFVENVQMANFTTDGIESTTQAVGSKLFVTNTNISGAAAGSAIAINSGGTLIHIDRSNLLNSGTGLTNTAGAVTISNSLISGNTNNGLTATTGAAVINANNNEISHNGTNGVNAAAGSVVRLNNNNIFRNVGAGFSNAGTMETFRNNKIRGNLGANVGVLTDVSAVNTGIF
jgi:hypothetical protein